MTDVRPRRWRALLRAPMFSPAGFLVRAGLLAMAYGVCHVAGLRERMSFLSGTPPATGTGTDPAWAMTLGAAYFFCYFAFVLVVPVLILAAGLLAVLGAAAGRAHPPAPAGPARPEPAGGVSPSSPA